MDKNRLIGNNNALPWHLPADLEYFKKTTTSKTVIMGRKTFDSIGRALPNRNNIILSRDTTLAIENCTVIHSLKEIPTEDSFIIGGSNIYSQTLGIADKLFITEVDGEFSGDAYFPEFDASNWQLISEEKHQIDEKNAYEYTFKVFKKRTTE